MNRKLATLRLLSLAALAATSACRAGGNLSLGYGAAADGSFVTDCIAVGDGALRRSASVVDSIAIGPGALSLSSNVSSTVAIGRGELAREAYETGATSINGRQLYISRTYDAFCLNPQKAASVADTPLWYRSGTLHLNADATLAEGDFFTVRRGEYDFFVAPWGNDLADGLTPASAKRNPIAVIAAANARASASAGTTNALAVLSNDYAYTCAVFPGVYTVERGYTPKQAAQSKEIGLLLASIRYRALAGRNRTVIEAPDDNLSRPATNMVNLAWPLAYDNAAGCTIVAEFGKSACHAAATRDRPKGFRSYGDYHAHRSVAFEGFTVRNFASSVGDTSNGNSLAPTFGGVDFIDCTVSSNLVWEANQNTGSIALCRFTGCDIRDNTLYHSAGTRSSTGFYACDFVNSTLSEPRIPYRPTDGATGIYFLFRGPCTFSGTFARLGLAGVTNATLFVRGMYENGFGSLASASNSTFLAEGSPRLFAANGEATFLNCYIASGDGEYPSIPTNGVSDCITAAWTNALLSSGGAAVSPDCPAVRDDGRPDAGWRDSGLGLRKALLRRADIRLEGGDLVVYTNGVRGASIPLSSRLLEQQ